MNGLRGSINQKKPTKERGLELKLRGGALVLYDLGERSLSQHSK